MTLSADFSAAGGTEHFVAVGVVYFVTGCAEYFVAGVLSILWLRVLSVLWAHCWLFFLSVTIPIFLMFLFILTNVALQFP